MKKTIKISLFVLGILILVFLIYKVGFLEIVSTISKAKIPLALLGLGFYLLTVLIRAFKWFFVLKLKNNKIKFRHFLPIYFINSLISNITPYKSGQAITPFLLKKYLKIPVGQGFFVIILDGFFELFVFIFYLFGAVLFIMKSGIKNAVIVSVFQNIFIILFLFTALLLIVIFSKKLTFKILGMFNFLKKNKPGKKILEFAKKQIYIFYNALPLLKNRKIYQVLISLTIISWFFEILSFYFIVGSVLPASFLKMAASQIISIAATFITFIPGGIGIGEVSVSYILNLWNYPLTVVVSGVLLIRLFLTGTIITLGLIGFFFLKERKGSQSRTDLITSSPPRR